MSKGFEGFISGVMVTLAVVGMMYDSHKGTDREREYKNQQKTQQLESDRKISSAFFQDLNLDSTNDLVIADRSGRTTPLFLYDSESNQYFSAETIREMKARELENQMKNYTNSAEATK